MGKNKIILDLEATCNDEPQMSRDEQEIIEIGACVVSPTFEVLDTFQIFIKPVVNPQLTPFCISLTKITQQDVDGAPEYHDAIRAFDNWIEESTVKFGEIDQWGSWGDYDRKQFTRHALLMKAENPLILAITHVNIKRMYSKALGIKKELGLGKALNSEGLKFQGQQHRALDDTLNIVRLAPIAFGMTTSAAKCHRPPSGPGMNR
jgi:inhibitor of KinA sporulation pathway (predicted exonuclease)